MNSAKLKIAGIEFCKMSFQSDEAMYCARIKYIFNFFSKTGYPGHRRTFMHARRVLHAWKNKKIEIDLLREVHAKLEVLLWVHEGGDIRNCPFAYDLEEEPEEPEPDIHEDTINDIQEKIKSFL